MAKEFSTPETSSIRVYASNRDELNIMKYELSVKWGRRATVADVINQLIQENKKLKEQQQQ